jgi:hypothetical protein
MAAEKPGSRTGRKRISGHKPDDTERAKTTKRAEPEPSYVDINPWAVLVAQLMEVPEKELAERKRPKAR